MTTRCVVYMDSQTASRAQSLALISAAIDQVLASPRPLSVPGRRHLQVGSR